MSPGEDLREAFGRADQRPDGVGAATDRSPLRRATPRASRDPGADRRRTTRGDVAPATTRERTRPREQFLEEERLGDVIIGSCAKAGDAVCGIGARGQHEDRRPDPALAQLPAEREPVEIGQAGVKHDHVELAASTACSAASPLPAVSKAMPSSCTPCCSRLAILVLDDQHAHGS